MLAVGKRGYAVKEQPRRATPNDHVAMLQPIAAWFVGALVVMVYLIFAMTLYLLPPAAR